ncbi:succinate dehydrogenase membrane anchor subunit [Scheffersomyces coipomensis]|uniref:succinate dehydrogenase membrane anchor subunit n=1 Tax=Scheffersomyces coipomensis TaxID=1788519 RepID=UPI00315CC1A8
MLSLTSRVGLARTSLPIRSSIPLLIRGIKTIPQPPGYIVGTVNDAYVPPKAHKLEGSYHWTSERLVALGLAPLTLAPLLGGTSTLLDSTLSVLVLYHSYTGFQSCIIDYIPKRVYGSLHNYAMYLLTFGTGVAGYGLYKIETSEEGGVSGIVKKIYTA